VKLGKRLLITVAIAAAIAAVGFLSIEDPFAEVAESVQSVYQQARSLLGLDDIDSETVYVRRVVDGDTVIFADATGDDIRVRLIGIDAPESDEAGGEEATAFVEEKLYVDRQVWLEVSEDRPTDRFGRTRAYVWLKDPDSEEVSPEQYLLNALIVAAGHAETRILQGDSSRHEDLFRELEAAAQ